MNNPLTVVSVTPVPLSRDSRTLKQAMTLARSGYTSIVVADRCRWDLSPDALPQFPFSSDGSQKRFLWRWLKGIWDWARSSNLPAALQFPFFLVWLGYFAFRYIWQVAVSLPPASLYCLHEFSSFPAVWLMARRYKTPILYDAHDFYSRIEKESDQSSFHRRFLSPFQRKLERACVANAKGVLTVSEGIADLFIKEFSIKPTVVRNCHDPRLDVPVDTDIRAYLGLPKDIFLLVTIGNCKKGQKIISALEALLDLPDHVHLVFVGQGYEVYAEAISKRGLQSRVHLAGFLAPTKLVPCVKAADASLILYYARSENYFAALPNGLFQSIGAELPILYPNLLQISALMHGNGAGICINPSDPSSITLAVQCLLSDRDAGGSPELRHRLQERYTWANQEHLFMQEVSRALSGNRLSKEAN